MNKNKFVTTLMLGALLSAPLMNAATSFAAGGQGKIVRVSHSVVKTQGESSNPSRIKKAKRSRKHKRVRAVKSSKKRSKRPVINPTTGPKTGPSSMGA